MTLEYEQLSNDLYAKFRCSCGEQVRLTGYNDANFFDNVNAQPRSRSCKCGQAYSVQWFRDAVNVVPV